AIVWAFLLKGVTTYDQKKNEFTIPDEKKEEYDHCCAAVEDAINLTNDFASVAKAAKHGIEKLGKITLNPKTPIKVMLYPKAKGIADAFEIVGKPAAFEYKYDGFRMQIHKKDGTIQIFTRRLDDVTKQFPEVAKLVETSVEGKDFILDGEAVGYDVKTGGYVSFQSVSQRIKRKYDIAEVAAKFPVELNLFDVVELNGKNLLNEPFQKRREILDKIVTVKAKKIRLAEQIITDSEEKAQKFYEQSLKAGNEGVMVKNLSGTYTPGARVGQGVKVKPVMETLEVVITGAEWGEGKRGQWLATFIIAVRDPDSGELKEVGRVGTGFKEKEEEIAEGEVASVTNVTFQYMTDLLKPHIIKTEGRVMTVHPNIVIEVNYEEIQASPTYDSGYALRFPRFVKLREDRGPDDINTLQDIEDLYKHQRGR
ncbi:MAG: ATP-dependent DNA ligase, partial [Nanoarchaeota archaeon]